MSLRFNEIAEANLRSSNPLTDDQLLLLGEICGFAEKERVLDLACGKGEALVQWARGYSVVGVGVEANRNYIDLAQDRAYRMDVGNLVNFVVGEAVDYPEDHHKFDYVSYLGTAWLGDTLQDRVQLMMRALKAEGGTILLGETYWRQQPTELACDLLSIQPDVFMTLGQMAALMHESGVELAEMVLADPARIDRYEAQQWMAVRQFLDENPDDRDAAALQGWIHNNRNTYLTVGRDYLGWGVFVLRPSARVSRTKVTPKRRSVHPVAVDFDAEMIWLTLSDGRIIGNPLDWYAPLVSADDAMRHDIELQSSSIHWPSLGLTIPVRHMLQGRT